MMQLLTWKRAYCVFLILVVMLCYQLFSETRSISITASSDGTNIRIPKTVVPEIFFRDCSAYSANGRVKIAAEILKRNGCKKRFPKAMIIGVKKCGTMMLTQYLSLHPIVAIEGELPVPLGRVGGKMTADAIEKWRLQMPFSSSKMFTMIGKPLDVTGFAYRHIPSLLDQNAKLIMIVRDPVVRAVSDYVHTNTILSKKGSNLLPPFNEMVVDSKTGKINDSDFIVAKGRYIEKFYGYIGFYGRNNLLVLDGEAFIQDPLPIMIKIEKFLGLPNFFKREHFQKNPQTGFYCANVTDRPDLTCADPKIKGRPHPQVDSEISEKLYEYYRPFNLQLAREADIYSHWLFQ